MHLFVFLVMFQRHDRARKGCVDFHRVALFREGVFYFCQPVSWGVEIVGAKANVGSARLFIQVALKGLIRKAMASL